MTAAALVDDDHDDGLPLDADLDTPNSGPAPEQTARWVDALWGNRRGWAALAYASDPYRAARDKYCHRVWTPYFYAWPDQRHALLADVTRELATGVVDVYVAPHLRSTRKRTKHSALPPRFLHADIDGQVADRQLLEQIDPIRVQSGSPGHEHGYVPLTRGMELPAWDLLVRALRDGLGGDTDSKISDSDVLRLPGTLNYKPTVPPDGIEPGEPAPVALLPGGGRIWDPDELAELLGVDLTAPLRNPTQGALGSLTAVPAPDPLPKGVITVIDRHRDNTDRSAVTHAVINACCLAGLTRDESFAVILAHVPAALDKYGERLPTEFDRSWGKALAYRIEHAGDEALTDSATLEEISAIWTTFPANTPHDISTREWLIGDETIANIPRVTYEELELFINTFTRYNDLRCLSRRVAQMETGSLEEHARAMVDEVIDGAYSASRALVELDAAYRRAGGTTLHVPQHLLAVALGAALSTKAGAA